MRAVAVPSKERRSRDNMQHLSTSLRKIDLDFLLPRARLSRPIVQNREGYLQRTICVSQEWTKEGQSRGDFGLQKKLLAGFGDSLTLGLAAQVREPP